MVVGGDIIVVMPEVVGVITSVGIRCGSMIGLKPLSTLVVVNCSPSCNVTVVGKTVDTFVDVEGAVCKKV